MNYHSTYGREEAEHLERGLQVLAPVGRLLLQDAPVLDDERLLLADLLRVAARVRLLQPRRVVHQQLQLKAQTQRVCREKRVI